jgi:hypothetical protein
MIIGYLLVCFASECRVWTDHFESVEACEVAGVEATVELPKLYPQTTRVDFKCTLTGVPVKETY